MVPLSVVSWCPVLSPVALSSLHSMSWCPVSVCSVSVALSSVCSVPVAYLVSKPVLPVSV
ncbi:hypothetical protein BAY61_13975 [Prauserella marina]|nr:hypothetical protein BAY61_13975 [Prauserella marina]